MIKKLLDKIHNWADRSIVDELLIFAVIIAMVEANRVSYSETKILSIF